MLFTKGIFKENGFFPCENNQKKKGLFLVDQNRTLPIDFQQKTNSPNPLNLTSKLTNQLS